MNGSERGPLSQRDRSKAQTAAMLSQMFGTMIAMVASGQYIILYANDVLGFSPQSIALIFSVAPFAAALRLPAMPYVQQLGLVNSLQVSRLGQAAVLLALLLIPAVNLGFPLLVILIAWFVVFRELGMGTVWQPLMRHITTIEDRGAFFGRMRTLFMLVNLSLSGTVAVFIGRRLEEYQFKVIVAVAIIGSLNAVFWSRRLPEPPRQMDGSHHLLRRMLVGFRRSIRSPLFRLPLVVTLVISMAQLPIALIYFREALHVPADLLGLQIFCATLGQVMSLILWGRVSDTLGFRPMLAGLLWLAIGLSLILWLVVPFPVQDNSMAELFARFPVSTGALLLFGLGNGILNAGLGIATTSVMHYHVDERNSLAAMNLFALVQLLFQAVVMLLLGALLQRVVIPTEVTPHASGLLSFDWFKAFRSGLVPVLMLLSIPLVLRLPNLKPWFSVNDFFAAIRHNPVRSLFVIRKVYDESEEQRLALARSLGDSPNPLNYTILERLLRDPSIEVKVEAIRSLARTRSAFAGETLVGILKDPERRVLWDPTAWALGELRHADAVPILTVRLADKDIPSQIRAACARALGRIRRPEAINPIQRALSEEEEHLSVISACAWALLHLNVRDHAESAFRSLLRLRNREERYELMSILSRWMEITDRWVLLSESDLSARRDLERFIEEQPAHWKQERAPLIEALTSRDAPTVSRALEERIANPPHEANRVVNDLVRVLRNNAESWSPLCVLAVAYLCLSD